MANLATLSLAPLDVAVILVFLAVILALGFSAKLRDSSVLQFLTAGRSLTLPVFVATLVTTWYGGILGVGESVTFYGVGTWLLLGLPYYVFALIYALFLAGKVRGAEQISIPERLHLRFGKSVALIGAGLVFLLAIPAAHVLMLGVLVRVATGWGLTPAIIVATAVGTLFLYKGGLLADVRVGMLAFLMMYAGFAVIAIYCLLHYPLVPTFARVQPRSLLTFTGGNGPLVTLSFFILGAWTMVDPGFHQRVASSKDPRTGRNGVLVSVLFWFIFDMLSMTTGMYALALLRPLPSEPLQIFPVFGDQVLPSGLKAVFLCGILGTVLSAMVGYTLVSGATIGREIVARLRGDSTDRQIKAWTRIGLLIACVVAVLLALQVDSVVNLWYAWGGAVTGALLIPVTLAYLKPGRKKISSAVIGGSMVASFGLAFGWMVYGYRTNNPELNVAWIKIGGAGRFTFPPIDGAMQRSATETVTFGLGTLIPGLVISALIIGAGSFWATEDRG